MAERTEETPLLGTGWAFPPTFTPVSHLNEMVSGAEDIEQSLTLLLSTLPGERVMQPRYGCDLTPVLFEPLTTSLSTDLADRVRTAILYYEPRVVPEKVALTQPDPGEGLVLIEIDYVISATNSRHNFVYPYYLKEGVSL